MEGEANQSPSAQSHGMAVEILCESDDDECCIVNSHDTVDVTDTTILSSAVPVVEDPSGLCCVEYLVPNDSMPQAVCNIEDVHVSPMFNASRKNCLPPEVFGIDLGTEEMNENEVDYSERDPGHSANLVQSIQDGINRTEVKYEITVDGDTYMYDDPTKNQACKPSESNDNTEILEQVKVSSLVNHAPPTKFVSHKEGNNGVDGLPSLLSCVKNETSCDAPVIDNDLNKQQRGEPIVTCGINQRLQQIPEAINAPKTSTRKVRCKKKFVKPVRKRKQIDNVQQCKLNEEDHGDDKLTHSLIKPDSSSYDAGKQDFDKFNDTSGNNVDNEDDEFWEMIPQKKRKVRKRPPTKDGSFSCDICSTGPFTTQRGLSRHMFYHDKFEEVLKDGKYLCQVCNKTFKRKSYLLNHRWVHIEAPFRCSKCNKRYPLQIQLESHLRRSHPTKQDRLLCTICGRSFAQNGSLQRHLTGHKNKNLLLSMNADCANDKNSERDIQKHPCLACGMQFVRPIRWLHHMKCHLNTDDLHDKVKNNILKVLEENKDYMLKTKVYICEVCGNASFYQSGHVLHMSKHTGNTPFGCKLCPKKYASERLLHTHEREVHSTYGRFKCSLCEVSFPRKSMLKNHQLNEHGKILEERLRKTQDYNCDLCSYSAKMKQRILFHMAQVHQLRDIQLVEHKCKSCSKIFATSYALHLHENTHNKSRPYECSVCGKAYSDPSNLIHHGRKQHPEHPKELFYRPRW